MMEVEWRLERRISADLPGRYLSGSPKRERGWRKGKSLNLRRFLCLEREKRLSLSLGFGRRRASRGREGQGEGRERRGEPGEEVRVGSRGTFFPFLLNICKIDQTCANHDDERNASDIS